MDASVPTLSAAVQKTATIFDNLPWKGIRRAAFSYAYFWKLYASDLTFAEIARTLDETRQAAVLRYDRWFARHQGPRAKRLCRIKEARARGKGKELHERHRPFHPVVRAAKACGRDLQFLFASEELGVVSGKCPVYTEHGKCLRLYRGHAPFYPNARSRTCYARFQVSLSTLTGIHACVFFVDVKGHAREILVIRASFLRKLVERKDKKVHTFYVRLGPTTRRQHPNLRIFKNAWWVLDYPSRA